MKNKLKHHSYARETSPLSNIQTGVSFQAAESYRMEIRKKWKTFSQAHLEEFVLSEFEIDSETMEEHLQELILYMMQNQFAAKIAQD